MVIERIKKVFKQLLLKERSPKKLALALSVGIYIAFSPFPGFHTLMVFAFSWLMSLNVGIVLASSMIVNNPWTMVPVYGSGYVLGEWMCTKTLGVDMCMYNPSWITVFNGWVAKYTGMAGISLWSFIIGGNVLGIGLAVALYPLLHRVCVRLANEHHNAE